MSLLAAYAVPHPPLIVPAVGRGDERAIQATVNAYRTVFSTVARLRPQTVVVVSPHAPFYRDAVYLSLGTRAQGGMAQFRAPQEHIEAPVDTQLAQEIARLLAEEGIPAVSDRSRFGGPSDVSDLDHGTYIPLHFLRRAIVEEEITTDGSDLAGTRIVRVGLTMLGGDACRIAGEAIAQAAEALERRVVLIASGDLSHKLLESGPYGFDPQGPVFDAQIEDIFSSGQLGRLFSMDPAMCEAAAECGWRSFQMMCGALEWRARTSGKTYAHELLSHEGPFGVGYAVARFEFGRRPVRDDCDVSRLMVHEDMPIFEKTQAEEGCVDEAPEDASNPASLVEEPFAQDDLDPFVALAWDMLDNFVRTGKKAPGHPELMEALPHMRAGAFVSIHEYGGDLRGCIGTISACHEDVAHEIVANAVLAASEDPRFEPIRPEELDWLHLSVDILGDAEPIDSTDELDPSRYGVIVTKGWRRGLLLPNLDGIDTVQMQVAIARQKAGIAPYETDVALQRFEVVRHEWDERARVNHG